MIGGIVGKKQEMTKLRVDSALVPVTLIKLPSQEVVRYKTDEKDGYEAVIVGVEKKNLKKEKGQKVAYGYQCEFSCDKDFVDAYATGTILSLDLLQGASSVRVVSISKGKGFQGGIKRHNFAGGPATHGSKFHRALGSTGNRKPRRTLKGQKMAGRMGGERITLKSVPVVDMWKDGSDSIVALKGSVPGSYNSFVQLSLV